MTYADFCANNVGSFSQQLLEVLGRLQAHATGTVSSSIYIYDLVKHRILCASYPVAAMLGYTANEIHAMGEIGLASLIHPNDLNQVSEHYQRFTTLRYGEVITIEYRMRRADGTWCQLRSQETPFVPAIDGFPQQILGILQDITQLSTTNSRKPILSERSFRRYRPIQRVEISPNRQKQRTLLKINRPKPVF